MTGNIKEYPGSSLKVIDDNIHLTLADNMHPIALPLNQFQHDFPTKKYGVIKVEWDGVEGIPENLVSVYSGKKKVY